MDKDNDQQDEGVKNGKNLDLAARDSQFRKKPESDALSCNDYVGVALSKSSTSKGMFFKESRGKTLEIVDFSGFPTI